MTRDEFIDSYIARSEIDPSRRTANGFRTEGSPDRVALPCACGEDVCEGWAMISSDPAIIEWHNKFYAPRECE